MSTLSSKDHKTAIITGTSGNLGTNIAKRLICELPSNTRLTIIVTSRTLPNANSCIKQLQEFSNGLKREGIVDFDYCLIDFTNMVSILNAFYELKQNHEKIDYLFINAAQGVYGGIDWVGATYECCTNPIKGVTYPTYKIQKIGVKSKDGLGLVFQANVFGPYYFIHLLANKSNLFNSVNINGSINKSKIIWISSVMSKPSYLSMNDLQLIKSPESYEGSKRLVDLIHLSTFEELKRKDILQYLTHPGIFTSFSFFEFLNPITYYGMLFLFYLARWLGSPWHNISGWKAANSALFVALNAELNNDLQNVKYGSATKWDGKEYVKVSQLDGTGKDDVAKYFKDLRDEWDEKLKNQITDTRKVEY